MATTVEEVNCRLEHAHRDPLDPCVARYCDTCYTAPAIYMGPAYRAYCLSCWLIHCYASAG